MFAFLQWKSLRSCAATHGRATSDRANSSRLQLESLEDRLTPSGTSPLDLTTHGATGSINNAIFRQFDAQPTGSGVIDSFVRLQSNKGGIQQGYNSDHRPVQFDENTSPQFTRSLAVDSVPVVNIGGVNYREFLLDINQKASQPILSLDELRIYVGDAPDLTGYSGGKLAGLNAVYDLDSSTSDNWIRLNARLNQGSGKGDMLAYIPDSSAFRNGGYLYLYSKFGVNETPNGGFEEWATGSAPLGCTSGSISGAVVDALTGGGIQDQLVFLDTNNNGLLDSNEIFMYTDVNGLYQFNGLATGLGAFSTYTVTVQPSGSYINSEVTPISVSLQTCGQHVLDITFQLTATGDT